MVEPINSQEIFGQVSLQRGDPPEHTESDHRNCAYYMTVDDMMCEHGFVATGAFYNEDYVKELKEAAREVIAHPDDHDNVGRWFHLQHLVE